MFLGEMRRVVLAPNADVQCVRSFVRLFVRASVHHEMYAHNIQTALAGVNHKRSKHSDRLGWR